MCVDCLPYKAAGLPLKGRDVLAPFIIITMSSSAGENRTGRLLLPPQPPPRLSLAQRLGSSEPALKSPKLSPLDALAFFSYPPDQHKRKESERNPEQINRRVGVGALHLLAAYSSSKPNQSNSAKLPLRGGPKRADSRPRDQSLARSANRAPTQALELAAATISAFRRINASAPSSAPAMDLPERTPPLPAIRSRESRNADRKRAMELIETGMTSEQVAEAIADTQVTAGTIKNWRAMKQRRLMDSEGRLLKEPQDPDPGDGEFALPVQRKSYRREDKERALELSDSGLTAEAVADRMEGTGITGRTIYAWRQGRARRRREEEARSFARERRT